MAHVGKLFPRSIPGDLIGYDWPWKFMPRRWRIKYAAHSGGGPGPDWVGLTILSSLVQTIENGAAYTYTFPHPTLAMHKIEMDWRLFETFPSSSPTSMYKHRMHWRLIEGGVLKGNSQIDWIRGFGPWDLTLDMLQFIGWANTTFIPPTPGANLTFEWRWMKWSEEPAYHPYRH